MSLDRRQFLRAGAAAGGALVLTGCERATSPGGGPADRAGAGHRGADAAGSAGPAVPEHRGDKAATATGEAVRAARPPDLTLRIAPVLVELAPDRRISTIGYNGSVPGPLLRMREGVPVAVEVHNDTDTPELVHWHGQLIGAEADGAAEEGTPFVPPHGMRRYEFVPRPAGTRWVHTHVAAGIDLGRGTFTGQFAFVHVEPRSEPGRYDQEVFLASHEWEPFFTSAEEEDEEEEEGGDGGGGAGAAPAATKASGSAPAGRAAKAPGSADSNGTARSARSARSDIAAAPGPHNGLEIGYRLFSINGKLLGQGEPIRVRQGQRVLFHLLNASATEVVRLALPGHRFQVVALDGNPVPSPQTVEVLQLSVAERIDAVVEMNNPGVWVLGTTRDDDRAAGFGIVVEYAGRSGPPRWLPPPRERWDYTRFGSGRPPAAADERLELVFAKVAGGLGGLNRWTVNGRSFPDTEVFKLHRGRRHRLVLRNDSDDGHPLHLHRHLFEITRVRDRPTSGVLKDTIHVPAHAAAEIDVVADNPGPTLFHCHQALHMDFGFMAMFQYA